MRKHRSFVLTGLVGMSSFIPSHFIRLVRRVQFIAFFLARYMCRLRVICSSSDGKLASVCNYSSTESPSLRLLVLLYLYLFLHPHQIPPRIVVVAIAITSVPPLLHISPPNSSRGSCHLLSWL